MFNSYKLASYYSGRGEDDGGYLIKSEIGNMDDSETSLCEMDDSSIPANSAADHRSTSGNNNPHGNSIPFGALMVPPGGNGPPATIHPPSPQFAMMNGGANGAGPGHLMSTSTPASLMFSPPPGNNISNHIDAANMLHLSGANPASIHPNMTPIDKLYSMQNSYFNNPSECEC